MMVYYPAIITILLLWTGTALANNAVTAIDLANVRDIGGHARGAINVSPDGRWVVFQLQTPKITGEAYELSWMALSTHGAKAFLIADGGEILLNPTLRALTNGNRPEVRAEWSPDSKTFAYLVRREGQTQIWLSRPDRKGQDQLTHNAADVIDFAWSLDGSKLYFKTGLDRTQVKMRYREEGARGFHYDDRFHPWESALPVWRNCGDVTSAVSIARACEPALWIYEFHTENERLATSEEARAFNRLHKGITAPEAIGNRALTQLRRWADRHRYAWFENVSPETYRGYTPMVTMYALVDDEVRRCVEEVCRAYKSIFQNLWWSENGQEVVFSRRDGPSYSQLSLYAWAPSTGSLRKILQSDDWLSDCDVAGDSLICLHESWTQPRKIASVSLEDGSITTLYDPNPEFARRRFSTIEKLEWEDAFGNTTYGHLVYPINYNPKRTYPLVIVTYSSRGFLRGGVGDEYPIHPLAAEGFFVLSHDMPRDWELAAKEPDITAKYFEDLYRRKSVLSSQEHIIERLAKMGLIDKTRIAITGNSEGAAQTSYALTHSDITFAAAIASTAGSPNPSMYYLANENFRDWWKSMLNGSPDNPDSSMHVLSIGLNTDHINTPLLINTSDQEFRVSVENFVRLKDANKPIEMYVFPGEHHIKWRPDHRLAIYHRNIQWLKFWLMDAEFDDPIDPDQYTRWRKMRDEHCAWLNGDDTPPWYCENGEVNVAGQ